MNQDDQRFDRVWLIIEPSLRNFQPSEMGLLSDFIVARLREYRLNAELETIRAEQERALKERMLQIELSFTTREQIHTFTRRGQTHSMLNGSGLKRLSRRKPITPNSKQGERRARRRYLAKY